MDALFLRVCGLSLWVALTLAVVLGVRRLLTRRYTARWLCWVWLLLTVRLLVPIQLFPQAQQNAAVSVEIPRSFAEYYPMPEFLMRRQIARYEQERRQASVAKETAPPSNGKTPEEWKVDFTQFQPRQGPTMLELLAWAWLCGAVLCLTAHVGRYMLWRKTVLRWNAPASAETQALLAQECAGVGLRRVPRLQQNPKIASPVTLGYLHPTVLVPERFDTWESTHCGLVLRHEAMHIKRGDLWYKAALLAAAVLHWFNPVVWLLRRVAQQDLELSCDEAVLANVDKAQRVAYGSALLKAARAEKGGEMHEQEA